MRFYKYRVTSRIHNREYQPVTFEITPAVTLFLRDVTQDITEWYQPENKTGK